MDKRIGTHRESSHALIRKADQKGTLSRMRDWLIRILAKPI
jgi:hypothetical protein